MVLLNSRGPVHDKGVVDREADDLVHAQGAELIVQLIVPRQVVRGWARVEGRNLSHQNLDPGGNCWSSDLEQHIIATCFGLKNCRAASVSSPLNAFNILVSAIYNFRLDEFLPWGLT